MEEVEADPLLPRSGSFGPRSQLKPWEAREGAASQRCFFRQWPPLGPPMPIPGRGSWHSPSGRVNSRKVGSETTVWEMVCTGSNTQETSLGRQDLMQRTVSVFSWRSLQGTTAQRWVGKSEPQRPHRLWEERQVAGWGAPSQRQLHPRTKAASAAWLRAFLKTGPGPKHQRHPPVPICSGCG